MYRLIAEAFACSLSRHVISSGNDDVPISRPKAITDSVVFKNGMAVSIPNANGSKGNWVTAALGIIYCNGIIEKSPKETIQNLWATDRVGLQNANETILAIMANK